MIPAVLGGVGNAEVGGLISAWTPGLVSAAMPERGAVKSLGAGGSGSKEGPAGRRAGIVLVLELLRYGLGEYRACGYKPTVSAFSMLLRIFVMLSGFKNGFSWPAWGSSRVKNSYEYLSRCKT